MSATLQLEGLVAGYDEADVLSGVSLHAQAGEITCLLGANGAGKSTLIRAVLGLTPVRRGRVLFDGRDITHLPTHRIIGLGIACIPEGRRVFPAMTVEENLRIGAYGETVRQRIDARLKHIYSVFPRLEERAGQWAGTLSGGEQAMLSIGRGMMAAPRLLLVDEPSLGLSPLYVKQNFRIIQRIHESGVTVLLVEQNVRQTVAISHHGYVLAQGRISARGDAASLSDNAEVRAAYFGR
jgi:branched-chain amino acid transport system ATP-binding protein